ncbi:uncharacterized protein E0L32_003456 [Thyridium curvatum]|uniref:Uncharacterized protein n=1 Tax=Thyridium curvatum TaxID=1093900 RepID=A0A507BDU3_9PEZI|nr:uncharacterized protein E0L32_003456 [Thyridium curvatum]TPX16894.1 hypothetical protein E0L32_003456 [Thyridium curvatum]
MAAAPPSDAAAAAKPGTSYSTDPALYLYTSLTAGSSHIVTATSRLETILRANRVPFKAIDIATDEKARMLWGRRAGKDEGGRLRKLPGLVQMGLVLGDLVEIEDWNEYGELKQHVTIYYDDFTQPPISQKPKTPPPAVKKPAIPAATAASAAAAAPPAPPPPPASKSTADSSTGQQPKSAAAAVADTVSKVTMPIRSIAEEAAARAKQVHLQSLRDKVYGKGGSKDDDSAADKDKDKADKKDDGGEEEETSAGAPKTPEKKQVKSISIPPAAADVSTASLSTTRSAEPGLQSPTTGTWRDGASARSRGGAAMHTVQSPTSTSWKPTDVDAPITTYQGARVASVSEEEIQAIEKAQAIEERPEEEEEEEEEEEDSDEEEEEEDKEGEKKKDTTAGKK